MLVGAAATLLVLLLAAVAGIILRYMPVVISGLFVVVLVAIVWYLSSKYPGAARRFGARVWEALRSGASTVVDRLLGRRNSEVSEKAVKVDKLCRGVIV
jgi:Flp pilus assembly protein TadB